MEQSPTAAHIIEIAFRNFGSTAARNVDVRSTPRLRRTDGTGGVQDVWVPEVIPILAPGQEWRTFWDDGPLRLACAELKGEDAHTIDISYDGVDRTGRQTTTSVLDWAAHRGRLFVHAKTIDDAATALHDISKSIANWSDSPNGLSVFTRDGGAKDTRQAERVAEQGRSLTARREEAAEVRQVEGEHEPGVTP
jgi:hypothetical protein